MKKKAWVMLLALLTALIGIAVAVAAFLKKKGKRLTDDLDFDDSIYFDDDEDEYLAEEPEKQPSDETPAGEEEDELKF